MKGCEKTWKIRPRHVEIQNRLASQLGISPLLSQLLVNRNITTPEDADCFLAPSLHNLHSPFLMKDMGKAVERICTALHENEEIMIYGDYDVDGVAGTSALLLFLRSVGGRVSYFIPDRSEQGYGLKQEVLKRMKERGVQLLITVDCGSSDVEEVLYARTQGMDVIITDHHELPRCLPPAYAILNPKQPDCSFPFNALAGVGVVFNLLMALRKVLRDRGFFNSRQEPNLKEYLDLVALGTIADIMPLVNENRVLVRYGLLQLTEGCRVGIRALKEVCGLTAVPITSFLVAFRLAPRINAPGRMSHASRAVTLLTTEDYQEAQKIAQVMEEENMQRQLVESQIVREACALLEETVGPEEGKSIVLSSTHWHPGVIGICASKLVEHYGRPAVLIACDEKKGIGRGSARSPESFHLYHGLETCAHLLEGFGGHHSAAGLTIKMDKIEEFAGLFDRVVSERISNGACAPTIEIDAEVRLCEISEQLVSEIALLEPFGLCNPEPLFSSQLLDFRGTTVVRNGHVKFRVKEDNQWYEVIGFNMAEKFFPSSEPVAAPFPDESTRVKIAFLPQINVWQGEKSIQLKLRDIKWINGV